MAQNGRMVLIQQKYEDGYKKERSVKEELCKTLVDGRNKSDYNEGNVNLGTEIIMFDMIVKLQQQVHILEKKIEEYEKQALPVAELVDDAPVEYEPLFPVLKVEGDL
jgi:hypothetical protein